MRVAPFQGYFGALGAFLLNQGIEHEGNKHNNKDVDSKQQKRRRSTDKLHKHKRSKSLGSINIFST